MMLSFLYKTALGRVILKVLINPGISKFCGNIMNSRLSAVMIPAFIRKNRINPDEYAGSPYRNFNDFFCRPVKPGVRPIETDEKCLIAPCDGKLSVYKISDDLILNIKNSRYSIRNLLEDGVLASSFNDGMCLVFRLCVDNYHRYCYVESGEKGENVHIQGELHTVRPIALENVPVFIRNTREYTLLKTKNLGNVIQMEVGALLVGKIKNLHGSCTVVRGLEKGMFLFGGSTIIVMLQKNVTDITEHDYEIPVRMGQTIARITVAKKSP